MSNFSEKIKELTGNYELVVKETESRMNSLSMYSDEEIIKRRTAMLKSLDDITIDYDKHFNQIVHEFLFRFALKLPDDGKDHAMDINNALQIINMMGTKLDVQSLNNIIKPLVNDFKSIKTVCDLILTMSNNTSLPNDYNYSADVIKAVLVYSGVSLGIPDYIDRFELLENVKNSTEKYKYVFNGSLNGKIVSLMSNPTYSVLAAPDWIDEAIEMYNQIAEKYNEVFHIE